MPNAVIYARQSSGSDDFSLSVEQQILNCKRLAADGKFNIVGIFQDLNTSGETYPSGVEQAASDPNSPARSSFPQEFLKKLHGEFDFSAKCVIFNPILWQQI